MAPFIVFVVASTAFWVIGDLGVAFFQSASSILRTALGLMFLLTACAHWGKRRWDLIRMVPPAFPRPDLLVTVTGGLEVLGAVGLFIPNTAPAAGTCLAVFLIALFPANVYAARQNLTIAGQRVPSVSIRASMQVVFVAALVSAAWLK